MKKVAVCFVLFFAISACAPAFAQSSQVIFHDEAQKNAQKMQKKQQKAYNKAMKQQKKMLKKEQKQQKKAAKASHMAK
jgi:mRNA-degrading endonuclease RelE of RelBE toxin-antitoxin system